ncbi:MAG: hypothetical protein QOG45_500, partial [Chloroflexota bacterium]|nr:hypothetical protein [Chloroflexota bacterium]
MLPVRRRNALAVAALLAGGAGLSAVAPRHPAPVRSAPHSVSVLRPLAPGAPAVAPAVAAPAPPPAGQQVALPATADSKHAL